MISIDCLMPSMPGREAMRRRAAASFAVQELPAGWHASLSIDLDSYESYGSKLNEMISRSKADFFVLLDDDDWHSRDRVYAQIRPIVDGVADITGTSKIYYFDEATSAAWLFDGDGRWIGGMAFHRGVWERSKFENMNCGVDYLWQTRLVRLQHSRTRLVDLASAGLFVAGIHAGNTCQKMTSGDNWRRIHSALLPVEFIDCLDTREKLHTPEAIRS